MLRRIVAVALALGLSSTAASAITVSFMGTVSSGSPNFAGEMLTGTYTYDPSTAPRPGSPMPNVQEVFDAVTGLSFMIGGFSATFTNLAGGPEIQLDDGDGQAFDDRYGVASRVSDGLMPSSQIGGQDVTGFGFRLDDSTKTAISDATVLPVPDLSDYDSTGFFIFGPNSVTLVEGEITKVEVVPAPAAALLLVSGLAALALVRRRRV